MKAMAKHQSHSIEFKRQVAQAFISGETLHALSRRHDVSRKLIRIRHGGRGISLPSKYPPAKPGALVLEPLKAACPCRTRQSVPSTLWNAPHLMTCSSAATLVNYRF